MDEIVPECPFFNCDSQGGGYRDLLPETQRVCTYSCCPCVPKPPEPSPDVLEETQHKTELNRIHRSTQKLTYEIQYAKMRLALLKLNQEIEQLSSMTPPTVSMAAESKSESTVNETSL